MMATLKDIAKACDVSISAVCTAINHPGKISKDVRERILAKARELNYFSRKAQKVKKILLVFNNYKNHFYGEYYADVIFGITQRLSELELDLRIQDNFEVEYSKIYEFDGLIFVGKTPNDFLQKASTFKIPQIIAGHPNPDFPIPAIYQDSSSGVRQLVEYVQSCGHKHISIISGETNKKDIIWKEFYDTITAEIVPKNISVYQADYSMIQSVEIALNKILTDKKTTLILCSNDLIAYHVYKYAKKYEIKIPQNISVTGFDGITFPRHLEEPLPILTTVVSDKIDLGKKVVDLLLRLIKEPKNVDILNQIPMQIRIGHSVRRI
jgi:DNA-binding LacI/PurR family transcriptional regulator